jgi:Flp pilus assembly protein TadG
MFALISGKSKSLAASIFRSRTLRAFGKRQDGVAAVEFAIVAAPFLAMLFAIMQTALVFFAGQTLETAAAASARLILTGQAQTNGLTEATFKTEVCNRIFGLFDCANGMTVDVQKYSDFSSVDLTRPVGTDGKVKAGVYNPGSPCEIVVVRLIYQFPVYIALLGFDLSDMTGGKRLIVATSVFRNEPYQGTCS